MAVQSVVILESGGTVILELEGVNILDATTNDRALLDGIGEAVRTFQKRKQAEGPTSRSVPGEAAGRS